MITANDEDKLNEVEKICRRFPDLLYFGNHLENFPTIEMLMTGEIPFNQTCPIKRFLRDFIKGDVTTKGGHLARLVFN